MLPIAMKKLRDPKYRPRHVRGTISPANEVQAGPLKFPSPSAMTLMRMIT